MEKLTGPGQTFRFSISASLICSTLYINRESYAACPVVI